VIVSGRHSLVVRQVMNMVSKIGMEYLLRYKIYHWKEISSHNWHYFIFPLYMQNCGKIVSIDCRFIYPFS
jgi:hypothetical protein